MCIQKLAVCTLEWEDIDRTKVPVIENLVTDIGINLMNCTVFSRPQRK